MEKCIANQLVIYENDAVLVSYTNGAGLQVAPCGTVFTYHHPFKEGDHPLHGQKKILQRTCFVTSTFRENVIEALDFRNRFACRPYLLKELVPPSHLTKLHADVCDIAWPDKLHQADIQILPDNSATIKSLCNLGKLTLVSSRQLFNVQYFCQISQVQEKPKWSSGVGNQAGDTSTDNSQENRVDKMLKYCIKSTSVGKTQSTFSHPDSKPGNIHLQSNDPSSSDNPQWDYALVTQHFSVHDCPNIWQHPLNLVLEYIQKQRGVKFDCNVTSDNQMNDTENTAVNEEGLNVDFTQSCNTNDWNINSTNADVNLSEIENNLTNLKIDFDISSGQRKTLTHCVFCTLTKSLPRNCIASHLHKWGSKDLWDTEEKLAESAFVNGRIKVVCCRGVIYRFLWCQPRSIEIYPGDGTVLRSTGLSGHFFTHFVYNSVSAKVEEKMYSITTPPPDVPGAKYSIARILKTGERFLRHLYEDSLSNDVTEKYCCWKTEPQSHSLQQPLPNVLLEECVVPGVGKFTAHSSGRVRIVFADRTALDMYSDFSKRLGHCKQHSDDSVGFMPDLHSYQPKSQYAHRIKNNDLPIGLCRLMLPNGHFTNVLMSRPDKYEKYIKAAQEWAAWVNSSPNERHIFYKDTLHDTSKVQEIDKELRKINCFNYIIENTLLSQFDTKNTQCEMYLPSSDQTQQTTSLDPYHSNTTYNSQPTKHHSLPSPNIHLDQSTAHSTTMNTSCSSIPFAKSHSMLNTFRAKHPHTRKMEQEALKSSYYHPGAGTLNNSQFSESGSRNNHSTFLKLDQMVKMSEARNNSHQEDTTLDLDMTQDTAFNLNMVEQILRRTSQAVSDLDQFLNADGKKE